MAGRACFRLASEHNFLGDVWLRAESPYALNLNGAEYAVDFTLWHGGELGSATRVQLLRGSASQQRALLLT